MVNRVLICNRGEIAVRIIRACRDLGLESVQVYSTADRDSLAVQLADHSVHIGPGPVARSYTNIPAILYAAAKSGADAVHPGCGFVSEDPVFAASCRGVGLTFVGPAAEHIALMGDKVAARAAMRAAGVPVLPGSDGTVDSLGDAVTVAGEIGFPLIVKAVAGGGGRGIAVVHQAEDLPLAYETTRSAARTLFADDRVYLERYLPAARHIEVQVLADGYGTVLHLGERDCSVQRRHQKLVEESPSPALDPELRERLCAAAVAGARDIGYVSAGTFEFLVAPDGAAYFMEMNTRLQVEHPITEVRTGIDIVAWMIRIAAGEKLELSQSDVRFDGHSIEARINAEDVARDWAGSTGRVHGLRMPAGPGVRVDSHLYDGYVVPPFYDSLLAKVVTHGATREEALDRLDRALAEYRSAGVTTNVDFHRRLLRHPGFRSGDYQLGVVESVLAEPLPGDDAHGEDHQTHTERTESHV
ncbi:acetyl-CoA carboxylase biotin carboxylase subunit [Plantactinospora endophytica]|uniref:biotin carboxylase n=1 Tax=Plantactinospora endophytica TaxID=673535 RepID=A0ABQ4EAN5_9ACTN|nr:acetyl-CoA carboxylase biotin carboxylase subunit [Plantactinospora endophytica]GIG91753.1 acetyl-CoA carboxylase biotin carboxylase subunit [Plantactinospora endophytica]